MKIATFNVNGIGARTEHLVRWLERESPDVACLQELKAPDERFPAHRLESHGYYSLWHGQTSWNGVAILVRGAKPKELRRGLPGDPNDTHSRYLEADVGGITIACLYLPNGNPQPGPKFDYKLAWFERLNARAKTLVRQAQPVVLCGDFNVVPTDFDIYNPKSWRRDALLQPASREAYARLLKQGWTDSIRTLYPESQIFTFWDYFRNHWLRDAGLRIDHLLLNKAAASRLKGGGVDRWVRGEPGASDHAPTWIELATAGARSKPTASKTAKRPKAKRTAMKRATVKRASAKRPSRLRGRP